MEPTLKLSEKVKQDVLTYRARAEAFVQGQTSPTAFRAYRVPMGVYEQRTPDTYMVRVRIGAGIASSRQIARVAELSRVYGNGVVHVTTRQDLQIHNVSIEQTSDVQEGLLDVGLSARGGGGNTVRNVTACPRAGICPSQRFNVAGHAEGVAEYLMQFDSSYNLPRKYKIAFSGCSDDCAYASVADLGFFAHHRDGLKGFSVYAGGGLGAHPAVGVRIEEFIAEHEIFEVAEAVKRLFDKHGDRANKHKARLRYVLARVGREEFVQLYRDQREQVAQDGLEGHVPGIASPSNGQAHRSDEGNASEPEKPDVLAEIKDGLYTIKLTLPLGDIPAEDLVRVAHVAEQYGVGQVRTTQQQGLLIASVAKARVDDVLRELSNLSVPVLAGGAPTVVACTGAATCKLGLCLSRGLAEAITNAMGQTATDPANPVTIRISGCPNSCGHHCIGQIGFQGRAKRVNGRLMPYYDVLVGARTAEGTASLAETIGSLPAKVVPAFIHDALEMDSPTGEQLGRLVAQYATLPEAGIPEDYYLDWGANVPFSLAGRGPGECGAGVMDVVQVDIDEARESLAKYDTAQQAADRDQCLYRATLTSARALLVIFGLEPKTDRAILQGFRKHLIEPGWVEPASEDLLDQVADWRMGDRATLMDLHPDIRQLATRIEQLYLSLDANLKFALDPIKPPGGCTDSVKSIRKVDLRGVPCPMNFVKAKLAVESVDIGEILEIAVDDGEPIRNVPGSLTGQGQEILETTSIDNYFILKVRRAR